MRLTLAPSWKSWRASFGLAILCWLMTRPVLAQNTITMGVAEAAAGRNNVHVIVTATHDQPIHGYQIAFTYPADVLTLIRLTTIGTDLQEIEPEFEAPTINNTLGLGSLGVILTLSDTTNIEALPATGGTPRSSRA